MKVIVTGAAGFIGSTLSHKLLERGDEVLGIDCMSDYYSVALKEDRLRRLEQHPRFTFKKLDISDSSALIKEWEAFGPDKVAHLAAQAGVRYSLTHPEVYIQTNLVGFANILEAARKFPVDHLVYASSSSVYGANAKLPFSIRDTVDHPVSLYAATKKSNEVIAHSYSHLYGMSMTGLRFFTVYGPWGRPDMALFIFVKKILNDEPIDVFNHGKHSRDFTYIDDIVTGVTRVLDHPAQSDTNWNGKNPTLGTSHAPHRIYNIGNNTPVVLTDMISIIEKCLGKKAKKNFVEMQPGDVEATYADIDDLHRDFGFKPETPLEVGIGRFVDWYMDYFGVKKPQSKNASSPTSKAKGIEAR